MAHITLSRNLEPRLGHRRVELLYLELVKEHRKANAAWRRIGHLTVELLSLGETYTRIQRRLQCSKTSLFRWAQVVRAFPTPDDSMLHGRPACMSVLNLCVSSARQLEGLRSDRWIPAAREALVLIGKMKTIPSVRKLSAALARPRQARLARLDADARRLLAGAGQRHAFHNGDCVDVVAELEDDCLDLVWLDPCYMRAGMGGSAAQCRAMSPLTITAAANPSPEQSRAVLRRLIPLLPRKLKKSGIVVYWGDGRSHDDPEVVSLFLDHGLRCVQASLWRKWSGGSGPAGSMKAADGPDGERYLVWARAGYVPLQYDCSLGRHGVIEGEALRTGEGTHVGRFEFSPDGLIDGGGLKHRGMRHLMEKPTALAERFFRKYLGPDSLVFDAFGCSGSACVAAATLGHRFIYCELHRVNYRFGSARIARHLDGLRRSGAPGSPVSSA